MQPLAAKDGVAEIKGEVEVISASKIILRKGQRYRANGCVVDKRKVRHIVHTLTIIDITKHTVEAQS